MPINHKSEIFLLIFLGALSILAFFILRPFLSPLILAIVFAVVFEPLNRRITRYIPIRKGLAALLTAILILIFILIPLIFLSVQIFNEAFHLYSSLLKNSGDNTVGFIKSFIANFQKDLPFTLDVDLKQYLRQGLSWLLEHLDYLFASLARIMLNAFVFFVALYYLLKDGPQLRKTVIAMSPLAERDTEEILRRLGLAINSVIKGSLVIAVIQGILTGIGFTFFGVPNSILWGTVAALAALIPTVGTALVVGPGVLYLFFFGDLTAAIGLLVWGVVAVGLVDNFLGPKLVERGIQIHPLLILLSVLGGIQFFGPLGFIMGPLILSLLFAVIDVYTAFLRDTSN